MKMTLIMPGVGRKPGEKYVASWKMEPLGAAVLAALTPPDVELAFVDDRCQTIPYDTPTDAVGLNVETYTARRAYAIAARFRHRGVKVILGGYHPTLVPQEALAHADAIVEGQAEDIWPQVLADLRGGCLQPRYRGGGHIALAGRLPRRAIFAGNKYLPMTLIETGRGCRFGCDFCAVSRFYRQMAVARPITDVVAEIEAAGRRNVFFIDDNIVTDPQRAKRLFKAISPARLHWVSQGSITMADDLELLALMRNSGCQCILIGFESLNPTTLATMGKSWNRAVRDYQAAISRIRDAGISIYATFVFGYDTDGPDVFKRTTEFAINQRFSMAAFNHLVPFPGTPLYDRLKQEGRILRDPWWLDPAHRFGDVAFQPRNMSAAALAEHCYTARRTFYRYGSIFKRGCDFKSNCRDARSAALFLWLNFFSGREIRQRQGLPLGDGFDDGPASEMANTSTPRQEVSV